MAQAWTVRFGDCSELSWSTGSMIVWYCWFKSQFKFENLARQYSIRRLWIEYLDQNEDTFFQNWIFYSSKNSQAILTKKVVKKSSSQKFVSTFEKKFENKKISLTSNFFIRADASSEKTTIPKKLDQIRPWPVFF